MRGLLQFWVRVSAVGLLCLVSDLIVVAPAVAEDWLPINPDDLTMTSEPKAPGASAIYLFRQVDRSDASFYESYYERLKILTDEGRKYANIEVPYDQSESVYGLTARTIRPDGTVIPFTGTIYDKPIVSVRGVKLMTKTLTLPEAGVGSIIEVRYGKKLRNGWVYDSHWIVSQELYTREAKFSLEPNAHFALRWSWPRGLPGNEVPNRERGGHIRLDVRDVPAFATEEFMPPENELKFRVDFIYSFDNSDNSTDPAAYWKRFGRQELSRIDRFIDHPKPLQAAVAQTVQPGDTSEMKLRKLYARAQQIHNTSYDRARTEEEQKREAQKEAKDVEDVLSSGRGDGPQVTMLFLGLARAAGLQADLALVSTRDRYFFNPALMNSLLLNSYIVIVKLDGKDLYLDPGVPFTPFGQLPWMETGVSALRLDKSGTFVTTPTPAAEDSRIERKATLKFDRGSLEGTITVSYTGLEASWRRLDERDEDDTDRRDSLKGDLQGFIPTGIDVKLTNQPDWDAADAPLVAQFDVTIPGWGQGVGRRVVFPTGLFGGPEKHKFEHVARTQPLFFDFPYRYADDVTITMPPGWKIDSTPKPKAVDLKGLLYKTATETEGRSLHLTRQIDLGVTYVDVKAYPAVRNFYQTVRAGDDEQVVVSPDVAVAPVRN